MKHKYEIFRYIILFLIGVIATISCENQEYQFSHGNIFGTITDATTGFPIENCNISVSNSEGNIEDKQTTDSKGTYKTKDLSDGYYTVSIEKEDYYTGGSKKVQVKSGETTKCDLALSRIPAKITADTEQIDFGSEESLTSLSFKIVNRYLDDLDWVVEYECNWIQSILPVRGTLSHGKTETIIVKIDRAKLSGGENKTNIVVKSPKEGGVNISVLATGEETEAPVLNTKEVTDIDKTSAVLNGEIVKNGIPAYTQRGFVCSLTSRDDKAEELIAELNNSSSFTMKVNGLTPGKKYYVRAFAVNQSAGKVWSTNEISFTTIGSYPEVRTDDVTNLDLNHGTCKLNGYVENVGVPTYSEKGFCVSDNGEPTINDKKLSVSGNGTGAFSSTLSGLVNEHTYRVRAYAIQGNRVFYGSTVAVSATTFPTGVATTGATSVTHNSAILNGTILEDGSPKYSERGFCYSTSNKTPTITNTKIAVSNTSSADFSYHLSNLEHNKTFWFRAYAIQNGKTIYGEVASFETIWIETIIFTQAATEIKYQEMTLNGQVNSAGTPAYSQKGFCYSLWEDEPNLNNSTKVTVSGTSEGSYKYYLKNLAVGTTYYFRAFAVQEGETIYGDPMAAKTFSPPQILTSDAYASPDPGMMNISWTVELNGVYGYKGDPECSDFGFVYGPGDHPTAENTYGYTVVQATKVVPFANSQGTFSVVLKEMVGYTKYYYRAYAKTSLGYTYGEVKAFSTQP